MRGRQITVYYSLLTVFILLLSCSPKTTAPLQASFFVYRFNPSAFVEYSADLQPLKEIPFSIPPSCGMNNTFPAPVGKFLAVELNCPNGQTVLFLDTSSSPGAAGSMSQPVSDSDSHFLAWASDGKAAYLRIESLGYPSVVRIYPDAGYDVLAINEFTYDLSARPNSHDFTFSFSRGLGYGSELHLAQNDGRNTTRLYADQQNYIAYARFSPDGKQIAFIKIPDTQTAFTVGELWVIPSTVAQGADGTNARKLADADAGHGYAANWSPDGKRIAFVVRENPDDQSADRSTDALISNIYTVDVETGELTQVTNFTEGRAETPYWSPDGNTLAFQVVING